MDTRGFSRWFFNFSATSNSLWWGSSSYKSETPPAEAWWCLRSFNAVPCSFEVEVPPAKAWWSNKCEWTVHYKSPKKLVDSLRAYPYTPKNLGDIKSYGA
jgi:hypothetical protein